MGRRFPVTSAEAVHGYLLLLLLSLFQVDGVILKREDTVRKRIDPVLRLLDPRSIISRYGLRPAFRLYVTVRRHAALGRHDSRHEERRPLSQPHFPFLSHMIPP